MDAGHNRFINRKRNIALQSARAEIVLFIDDDVIVPPGFLDRHFQAYHSHSWSGVTGQVYHVDANSASSIDHPHQNSKEHFIENCLMSTRSFIGCNHSIVRSAACAIGGFDEHFIASSQCEDFDFADRLADAGYHLLYNPDCWLIHLRETGGTRGSHEPRGPNGLEPLTCLCNRFCLWENPSQYGNPDHTCFCAPDR